MADILGTFYQAKKVRIGTSPSSPGVISGEPVTPVNPQGSNPSHSPVTIGTANGLSLRSRLSLGLASSGRCFVVLTWDTFNGKLEGEQSLADQSAFGTGASKYAIGTVILV